MNATLMSRSMSAAPFKDPRGRRRPVGYDRAAALKPIDLEAHKQLLGAHQMMSGRCRGYVYWWRKGKLHKRRYVIPKDPHSPTQQRARATFGTASKTWSENNTLTLQQRDAWHAAAAKIKSHPRLGQSGTLTAQQHIVGSNSLKERWGLPLLLEPPSGAKMKAAGRGQNTETAPEPAQPQALNPTSWDRPRAGKRHTGKPSALRVPIQVVHCQPLTRPTSERSHTSSLPLPEQCRWHVPSGRRAARIEFPNCSSTMVQTRRRAGASPCFRFVTNR